MLPIQTILHPTDFSEPSTYAFGLACSLARDYHARLVLLHVMTSPVVAYGEGVIPPEPERYAAEAQEKLEGLVPGAEVRVQRLMVEGDPAPEILRAAKETGCDVIVMGTHGRTGLGRMLVGSVAEQVLRRAPCPVLTVKFPLPQVAPAANPAEEKARLAPQGARA